MNNTTMTKNANSSSEFKESMLEEFFTNELKDIFWAEKHLVKELGKMSEAATTEELRRALGDHLEATKLHMKRLEEVFRMLGKKPETKKCIAIAGITKEGAVAIDDTKDDSMTRDVALIMSAQKAEHYEIATYGGLVHIARTLGRDDVANKLQQTLDEEKLADHLLSSIAEQYVNLEAGHEHM